MFNFIDNIKSTAFSNNKASSCMPVVVAFKSEISFILGHLGVQKGIVGIPFCGIHIQVSFCFSLVLVALPGSFMTKAVPYYQFGTVLIGAKEALTVRRKFLRFLLTRMVVFFAMSGLPQLKHL